MLIFQRYQSVVKMQIKNLQAKGHFLHLICINSCILYTNNQNLVQEKDNISGESKANYICQKSNNNFCSFTIELKRFNYERTVYTHFPEGPTRITSTIILAKYRHLSEDTRVWLLDSNFLYFSGIECLNGSSCLLFFHMCMATLQ